MEFTVKNKFIKISPRKLRPVLYGLRGQTAEQALIATKFINKKGAYFIHNLLKSGVAAAKENYLEPNQVFIKTFCCDEGPRIKRFIPWSKGAARRIAKPMSHLCLVLESAEEKKAETKATDINKDNNKENS
ncbi:MAG: 50S ribosomal protein L22 [Candidatus Berkelbacteria bacterium]|nr:50S ribosomal protein L22 [Candidatus Berkelbacteria bacterium]